MNLEILTATWFGWLFVGLEIGVLYIAFLIVHRKV